MRRIVSILVALAFVSAGTASAKVIEPGDLRLCGASRCAGIASPNALRAFAGVVLGSDEGFGRSRPSSGRTGRSTADILTRHPLF